MGKHVSTTPPHPDVQREEHHWRTAHVPGAERPGCRGGEGGGRHRKPGPARVDLWIVAQEVSAAA